MLLSYKIIINRLFYYWKLIKYPKIFLSYKIIIKIVVEIPFYFLDYKYKIK